MIEFSERVVCDHECFERVQSSDNGRYFLERAITCVQHFRIQRRCQHLPFSALPGNQQESDSPNNLPNSSTPSQAVVPLKSFPLTFNQVNVNFASLTNPISFRPQFDRSSLCKLVKLIKEGGDSRIWFERLR